MSRIVPQNHIYCPATDLLPGGHPLCDSTQNINTNWKTCEIQVERFWECSTSVFILLFTFVLFSLGIQQALYISLILSRCNFCSDQNVMTLYITIVNLNCEPLKQGLKIYMVFFIKYILYIHLSKESCKHFNLSPLTRTAQKVVQ